MCGRLLNDFRPCKRLRHTSYTTKALIFRRGNVSKDMKYSSQPVEPTTASKAGYIYSVCLLLAVDCGAVGNIPEKSAIRYYHSRQGRSAG